ncbi:MAG TPA: sugar phosphate isomerase/epimerase family protein [Chloroflexota bacterium]|nr:sugar phosphate isomerase/epimerase family protein [Chloroflexota bacterium]
MSLVVGCLAGQNWHRQMRRLGLNLEQRLDHMINKTAAIGKEFGFSPMGIDVGLRALPSQERSYLDEFKARLSENNLVAMMYVGGVSLSYDDEVRNAALQDGYKQLEALAYLGIPTAGFGCGMNGRVTREGRIRLAINAVGKLGQAAKSLGIRLCQEDFDYFTSDDLIRISAGTGLDNIGINSDTGNWLILGEDPAEATRKCLPYTFHSHVRDYVLEDGVYNGVALGRGLVDFPTILPILAQAGAQQRLILSVEVDTDNRDEDEEAHESYRYLKDWLVSNGHLPA